MLLAGNNIDSESATFLGHHSPALLSSDDIRCVDCCNCMRFTTRRLKIISDGGAPERIILLPKSTEKIPPRANRDFGSEVETYTVCCEVVRIRRNLSCNCPSKIFRGFFAQRRRSRNGNEEASNHDEFFFPFPAFRGRFLRPERRRTRRKGFSDF